MHPCVRHSIVAATWGEHSEWYFFLKTPFFPQNLILRPFFSTMKVPTVACLFGGAQAGLIAKPAQQPIQLPLDIDNQDIGDTIPGNSPFRHCTQFAQKNSIFQMSSLELHPTPPDVYSSVHLYPLPRKSALINFLISGELLRYKLSGTLSSPSPKTPSSRLKTAIMTFGVEEHGFFATKCSQGEKSARRRKAKSS